MNIITQNLFQLDALPIWRGVTIEPWQFDVMPFILNADNSGLMFQSITDEINTKVLSHYSNQEYAFITKPPGSSEWANHLGDGLIDFAISIIGDKKKLRILEIGGGSCYVAEKICNEVDPNEYVIVDPALKDSANNKKITVLSEFYNGQDLGFFDVILSFNCIEHLPEPRSFLASLSNIRSKNGSPTEIGLIFPNAQDQIISSDINVFLHEHINYFTPLSLLNLLNELDLELINYNSSKDEFKITLKSSKNTEKNKSIIHDSREDILEITAGITEKLKSSVDLVASYGDSAKKVGFHGATNGLNNILYLSRCTDNKNFYIFDGDKSKEEKFLPTLASPILHSDKKIYNEMDFIIISAMTYYNEIKTELMRHSGFSEKQIIPLLPKQNTKH